MSDTSTPKVARKRTPRKAKPVEPAPPTLESIVLACTTSAQIARALGKDGKTVRNYVRSKLGTYVSKGDTLTDEHKLALIARFAPSDTPTA